MKFKINRVKDTRKPVAIVSRGKLYLNTEIPGSDQKNGIVHADGTLRANGYRTIETLSQWYDEDELVYEGDTVEVTF